ncbi:nickel-dependent lactate racemase [Actinoallomurus rhizosphaericola]|uniref:nickel-dependent lactate racemase n=1 Tax=Actinoallomurus rhizosphaericola TaxID=2952536 RepID=UPI00209295D6|nr:nickel-dependent lactate racemase [Actinoallomurus rhizosphaericola]MCO5997086.1 nickel-dependent lactate racemase [Actinoallomurus rhizosphaericola]
MRVRLAYGETGLEIELPDAATTVVTPRHHPAAPDPAAALRAALRSPVAGPALRDRVHPGQTVAISACDGTRPQPRHLMIPAILEELAGIVDPGDVTVLVATGTHRGNTDAELREMFGDTVVDTVRVINHDARDTASLTYAGVHGAGVPVWLNSAWADADVRITTGFVEPHFFAGFSGGPKLVAPGLAGLETVLTLHDAARIGHPSATWGVTRGNPVHDDIRAIATATGVTFGLDVILNGDKEIVAAFGGDLPAMHAAATAAAREAAMCPLEAPFDVVVTTNAGYPLDQNLYQAVKGMSAAYQIVRPGGMIVCAAECRDGFPDHGSYREVLASAPSPQALLADISARPRTVPDQWQVQIQARIQAGARVVMHTAHLGDEELAAAHLEQTRDISATVADALAQAGPGARVCVLPEGPQTIPYLTGGTA